MIHTSRTRRLSFFILVLTFSLSIPPVQSNAEDVLYSHISDITINDPICDSRYNYTFFYVDFTIELYSTLNEPFIISTPNTNLFVPQSNVSFLHESYTYVFLYVWYAEATDHLIPPNTSTYLIDYAFAFKYEEYCFTRMPAGNYTVWLELAGTSPIPYQSFSSFIYVNETDIVISHEPYNNTLFTIPEYFQSFTLFGILQLSLILVVLFFYNRRKNYSKFDYKL